MAVLLRSTSAAASTAGPSSALLATTFRRSRGCLLPRAAPQRRLYVARASAQPLEVCAKESITIPGRLGDCPFTQRVLLTIEEKHLPYDLKLVDLANKPDWLFEINPEGKVPIVKLEEKWIGDSDVITQALEEKYPEPPLATPPEKASVGSKIFSTFIGFLKSKDPSDGTEEALLNELTSFDSYLKDNGPFINGGIISAADLSLGPKLYHMEITLGHYKNWSVPDSLSYVKTYMKERERGVDWRMEGLDAKVCRMAVICT
ncbi:glutathione dehydroascorbate reductase4 isoform X2 [Zea mays]|uniref:Glutathione S-transferase DHAR3 chloroplastic n=1 Tax=Zea mays TaxID=4577 RepID=A0A1D6LVV3_MAIZE|nr:glutathione dehydroascorbate reductase4 isoform X2 [Zea mays]AQK83379.1 Glutathione S-transferase DHAR3 chloroplastic [Zea mays]